jgi:hypothetical protein
VVLTAADLFTTLPQHEVMTPGDVNAWLDGVLRGQRDPGL